MGQFLPSGISLGGSFKASFTAPSEPSSAIVSGAGTAAANGTYTPRGTNDGKPYYNLVGQPSSPTLSAIFWSNGALQWVLSDSGSGTLYQDDNQDNVAFPWLATGWATIGGDDPPPTVTES